MGSCPRRWTTLHYIDECQWKDFSNVIQIGLSHVMSKLILIKPTVEKPGHFRYTKYLRPTAVHFEAILWTEGIRSPVPFKIKHSSKFFMIKSLIVS